MFLLFIFFLAFMFSWVTPSSQRTALNLKEVMHSWALSVQPPDSVRGSWVCRSKEAFSEAGGFGDDFFRSYSHIVV